MNQQDIIEWYKNATDAKSLLNTLYDIIRNNEVVSVIPRGYTSDMEIASAFIIVKPKNN